MFSLFCFTADFLLFCSTTVKISLLGVRPSVFLLIPSISGISLKFLKDSKSYVFRQLVKQLVYSPLGEYNLVSFHFWWTEIVPRCAEKRNFFLWLSEKLPFSFNFCENSRKLKKRSVFSKKTKSSTSILPCFNWNCQNLPFAYSPYYSLTPPISRVLIGQHLILLSEGTNVLNLASRMYAIKYKKRQKTRFPIVT